MVRSFGWGVGVNSSREEPDIGAPGPDLHVADVIACDRFTIAGGRPDAKMSWQVTGFRQGP